MAFPNAYSIYAIKMNPTGTDNDFLLDQISNQSHSFGIDLVKLMSDGAADPTFSTVGKVNAEVSFETTKVATALSKGGLSGFVIDSDGTNPGAEFYMQRHVVGGTREAKTELKHIKATMANGILYPTSLSASNTDAAKISFSAVGIYDGTNDPISYTTGSALPTDTLSVDEVYYVGPITIEGTTFEGVTNFSLDFGVKLNRIQSDGVEYETFVNIANREPVIKFTTHDVESALSIIGPNGTGHTQAATFYLRKAEAGGARVADATAEHIKLTTNEGSFIVREISGGSGEIIGAQVEVHPIYDGTNDVIVIDTASAIA